jgi:hypothetical protein
MIKLERTIEQYRNGVPAVIVEGSKAQILFALEDSRTDVLRLASHVETLEAKLERLTNLLCLADEALMVSCGCFPLDRVTEEQQLLNDAAEAIRAVTGDDYDNRKRRAREVRV